MSRSQLQEAALAYARKGARIFPIWGVADGRCLCGTDCDRNAGKHPIGDLVPQGFKNASYDLRAVEHWWQRYPDANIGLALVGTVALDIDPRNGGDVSLARLIAEHGDLPHTVRAKTGGGGEHIFFQRGTGELPGKLGAGIEIKKEGGYVVAPPSLHISGRRYKWSPEHHPDRTKVAHCPQWVFLKKRTTTPRATTTCDDGRIADALAHISSDDRETWVQVGQAIHHHYGGLGFEIWDQWSQTSAKYNAADTVRVWDSFGKRSGITIRTMFHHAIAGGWEPPPSDEEEREAWSAAGTFISHLQERDARDTFLAWHERNSKIPRVRAEEIFQVIRQKELP
jgi:Bifunctional DNA primase/polymerase, N-terminal/Primase C terminal 2 (PriCT-2)